MKVIGLYDSYIRRYGKSRRILDSKEEFLKHIKIDNGKTDVFISIFSYAGLKESHGTYKIDSKTAIVDKIFIDMDFVNWIDYDPQRKRNFLKDMMKEENHKKLNQKQTYILNKILSLENITNKERMVINKLYIKHSLPIAEKELFEKVCLLESILKKMNALRVWSFSGGGFHLYLYFSNKINNKKSFYKNAVRYISSLVCKDKHMYIDEEGKKRTRRIYDHKCPPKLSQMARVIGSYNPKRKLFCISLEEDDFIKGLKWIKQKAQKCSPHIHYLGNVLVKLPDSLDEDNTIECFSETLDLSNVNIKHSSSLIEFLYNYGILWDEIPLCMKNVMREDIDLNYFERYMLITFLYRCGLGEVEIKECLKYILTPKKLYHCCGIIKNGYVPPINERSRIETQIPDIINNDYYISCKQIKENGYCVALCQLNDVLYYFS